MSRYSVAATTPELTDLINRAVDGDEVVITKDGNPTVHLQVVARGTGHPVGTTDWLFARTMTRPGIGIDALELLRLEREECA